MSVTPTNARPCSERLWHPFGTSHGAPTLLPPSSNPPPRPPPLLYCPCRDAVGWLTYGMVAAVASHVLLWLFTHWNIGVKAAVTSRPVTKLAQAECIQVRTSLSAPDSAHQLLLWRLTPHQEPPSNRSPNYKRRTPPPCRAAPQVVPAKFSGTAEIVPLDFRVLVRGLRGHGGREHGGGWPKALHPPWLPAAASRGCLGERSSVRCEQHKARFVSSKADTQSCFVSSKGDTQPDGPALRVASIAGCMRNMLMMGPLMPA